MPMQPEKAQKLLKLLESPDVSPNVRQAAERKLSDLGYSVGTMMIEAPAMESEVGKAQSGRTVNDPAQQVTVPEHMLAPKEEALAMLEAQRSPQELEQIKETGDYQAFSSAEPAPDLTYEGATQSRIRQGADIQGNLGATGDMGLYRPPVLDGQGEPEILDEPSRAAALRFYSQDPVGIQMAQDPRIQSDLERGLGYDSYGYKQFADRTWKARYDLRQERGTPAIRREYAGEQLTGWEQAAHDALTQYQAMGAGVRQGVSGGLIEPILGGAADMYTALSPGIREGENLAGIGLPLPESPFPPLEEGGLREKMRQQREKEWGGWIGYPLGAAMGPAEVVRRGVASMVPKGAGLAEKMLVNAAGAGWGAGGEAALEEAASGEFGNIPAAAAVGGAAGGLIDLPSTALGGAALAANENLASSPGYGGEGFMQNVDRLGGLSQFDDPSRILWPLAETKPMKVTREQVWASIGKNSPPVRETVLQNLRGRVARDVLIALDQRSAALFGGNGQQGEVAKIAQAYKNDPSAATLTSDDYGVTDLIDDALKQEGEPFADDALMRELAKERARFSAVSFMTPEELRIARRQGGDRHIVGVMQPSVVKERFPGIEVNEGPLGEMPTASRAADSSIAAEVASAEREAFGGLRDAVPVEAEVRGQTQIVPELAGVGEDAMPPAMRGEQRGGVGPMPIFGVGEAAESLSPSALETLAPVGRAVRSLERPEGGFSGGTEISPSMLNWYYDKLHEIVPEERLKIREDGSVGYGMEPGDVNAPWMDDAANAYTLAHLAGTDNPQQAVVDVFRQELDAIGMPRETTTGHGGFVFDVSAAREQAAQSATAMQGRIRAELLGNVDAWKRLGEEAVTPSNYVLGRTTVEADAIAGALQRAERRLTDELGLRTLGTDTRVTLEPAASPPPAPRRGPEVTQRSRGDDIPTPTELDAATAGQRRPELEQEPKTAPEGQRRPELEQEPKTAPEGQPVLDDAEAMAEPGEDGVPRVAVIQNRQFTGQQVERMLRSTQDANKKYRAAIGDGKDNTPHPVWGPIEGQLRKWLNEKYPVMAQGRQRIAQLIDEFKSDTEGLLGQRMDRIAQDSLNNREAIEGQLKKMKPELGQSALAERGDLLRQYSTGAPIDALLQLQALSELRKKAGSGIKGGLSTGSMLPWFNLAGMFTEPRRTLQARMIRNYLGDPMYPALSTPGGLAGQRQLRDPYPFLTEAEKEETD